VYFLQQWFNLSDPGAEDALYESPVLRHFVGIDLGRAPVPDESTILGFRHLESSLLVAGTGLLILQSLRTGLVNRETGVVRRIDD
jgi:Transposase domain (DUF772)